MARASKERIGLFVNPPDFVITPETGKLILYWCQKGDAINTDDVSIRNDVCKSRQDLLNLYKWFPQYQETLRPEIEKQKREIVIQ